MLGVLSASAHGHRCSQLLLRGRRSDACRLGRCVTGLAVRTRLPPTARLTKIGLDPYRKMKINGQEPYNSQTKTSGWEPNRSIAVRTLDRAGREIEPSAQAMSSRRDLSTPKSESRLPCYGEAVLHDDLTSPNWTSSWCRPPCLVLLKCSWEVGPRRVRRRASKRSMVREDQDSSGPQKSISPFPPLAARVGWFRRVSLAASSRLSRGMYGHSIQR
jgi:hypothetical protein